MRSVDDIHTILIIGGGAREDTLRWIIKRDHPHIKVLCAPGNGGTPPEDRRNVKATDLPGIMKLVVDEGIDFVIVGPEDPLVLGLADMLWEKDIAVFGPSALAAQLEGSKVFTKRLCDESRIPTADWFWTSSPEEAERLIKDWGTVPVVKADGLCAGKGVVVGDMAVALKAAREMLIDKKFGDAGKHIVLEERLYGRECSVMAFCDGENAILLPVARDYKRALDHDEGPNTGGMGSYSPLPDVSDELLAQIKETIIMRALSAMAKRGTPYRGVLYAGIMVTTGGPMLVEFNCRFGDPETQVILPRIESDVLAYMLACSEQGGLAQLGPLQVSDDAAVCIVLASEGYPGDYTKGFLITGVEAAEALGCMVFHAGTDRTPKLASSGGRVMSVVSLGKDIATARDNAALGADAIDFNNKFRRTDIAARA